MSASQYKPLKCDNCGKTLGYIYISIKILPPEQWIRLTAGGPVKKIEKTAYCEECFQRRKAETARPTEPSTAQGQSLKRFFQP